MVTGEREYFGSVGEGDRTTLRSGARGLEEEGYICGIERDLAYETVFSIEGSPLSRAFSAAKSFHTIPMNTFRVKS